MRDVSINGRDQFRYAGEYATMQLLVRNVAEEVLHHVQPQCRGGREVHCDARVLGQPLPHDRMLVGRVVVGDQVQRLVFGRFTVNLLEELESLQMGMTLLAGADGGAIERTHGCKQCRGAIAHVVVRHRLCSPLFEGQSRLGTIQCLDLALLVAAQHQRVRRGRDVKADDIFQLFDELGAIQFTMTQARLEASQSR